MGLSFQLYMGIFRIATYSFLVVADINYAAQGIKSIPSSMRLSFLG
jgi:hypothetical protein